jgi:glutathione S-transferase
MGKAQIIGASPSPIVRAVRMAALEKDIDYEFIDARPHSPEISAIQPFGRFR